MTQAAEILPRLWCIVDTMVADGLAMQGARSTAATVLISFVQTIPVSVTERSTDWGHI